MPKIQDTIERHVLDVKNIERIRQEAENNEIISFVDHDAREVQRAHSKVIFTRSEAKKSRTLSMSKLERSRKNDEDLRYGYAQAISRLIRTTFEESCKALLTEHPLLESAITQTILAQCEAKQKYRYNRGSSMHARTSKHSSMAASLDSFGDEQALKAVSITLDLKSYMQHSETVKEVINSYKSVCDQNKKLHDRIAKLKMQHDKETNVLKHTQMLQADKDMKMLAEMRLHRNNDKQNTQHAMSDNVLDDYEHKIVKVEWFDSLEGIDEVLRTELNFKLARVRNSFQDLLDTNLKSIDKLNEKIDLMNQLTPDAYSVANLSLIEVLKGVYKKEKAPNRIWKALKEVFGEDYFLTVVEAQYGKRFVANYNALFNEVNQVKEHAEKNMTDLEDLYQNEVQAQKRIVQTLRQELSLFKENFRERIREIQEKTKQSLEKDFEQRESLLYQEHLKRENEFQDQLEERDLLYANSRIIVEKLQKKRVLEKLKMIALVKQLDDNGGKNELLTKILGFLRGETTSDKLEVEAQLKKRIDVVDHMNKDLCNQVNELDLKNALLQDQLSLLELQIQNIGGKTASAENKQYIAYEEKRKAISDMQMYKRMNDNLESICETHEREKENLLFELRRLSKSKLRSNYLEAELYRKKNMHQIDKRAIRAAGKVFIGVETHKSVQTDLGGIKKQIVQMTEKDYKDKFCKVGKDSGTQTDIVQERKSVDSSEAAQILKSGANSSRNNMRGTRSITNSRRNQFTKGGAASQYGSTGNSIRQDESRNIGTKSLGDSVKSSTARKKDLPEDVKELETENPNTQRDQEVKQEPAEKVFVEVGVTCNIMKKGWSPKQKRGSPKRNKVQHLTIKKDNESKNRRSESNYSMDGPSQSFTQLHPTMMNIESKETYRIDEASTLNERGKEKTSERGSSCSDDIRCSDERSLFKVGMVTRGKGSLANQKRQDKLNAGWKIVNERLKDIRELEKRQKSQIKFEVDKAFEMTKYLDETNFTKRDPRLSQAYISLIQMCVTKLDSLTPFMLLKKIEKEKQELQNILTIDPDQIKQNQSAVTKILNFVCLENLNSQILKIFTQVIRRQLPPSISDTQQNACNRKLSPVTVVSSRNPSRLRSVAIPKTASTQQLCQVHRRSSIESGVSGMRITTPRDPGHFTTRSNSPNNISITKKSTLGPNDSSMRRTITQSKQSRSGLKRSLKSVLTIKSNNQASTKVQSTVKPSEADSESIVKHLLTDSRSLKLNIEKTFQSSNQKAAIVQARMQAAKCFNSKGFQSLLTSQKLKGMHESEGLAVPSGSETKLSLEKRHYLQYRQKMKGFLNNNYKSDAVGKTTKSSNLFKQLKKNNLSEVKHDSFAYDSQPDDRSVGRLSHQQLEDGRKTVQIKTRKDMFKRKVSPADLRLDHQSSVSGSTYQGHNRLALNRIQPQSMSALGNTVTKSFKPDSSALSQSILDRVKSATSTEEQHNAYFNHDNMNHYQTIQPSQASVQKDQDAMSKSKSEIFLNVNVPATVSNSTHLMTDFFKHESQQNLAQSIESQHMMKELYNHVEQHPGLSTTSSIVVRKNKKRHQAGRRFVTAKYQDH